MNRRDRFAAWFLALPKGKKFAASLVLASTVIAGPALAAKMLIPPSRADPNTVQTACGGRPIEVSKSDPIWDENDLEATLKRMCDRAWGRS